MKTKALEVIALLLLASASFPENAVAQSFLTDVIYPGIVQNTIVRTYNNTAAISYVDISTAHYFTYLGNTSTLVSNVEIDNQLEVLDFTVFEDSLFFCGIDHSANSSFLGSMAVADLLLGNVVYNTYTPFVCVEFTADTLRGIVAYRQNNKRHIVMIGNATDGKGNRRACIIDVTESATAPPYWEYRIGLTLDATERFTRIVLTDNYVATIGNSSQAPSSETHRIHLRSNPLMVNGPQDTLYHFIGNGSDPDHPWGGFAATHIAGDAYAVAHYIGNTSISGLAVTGYNIPAFRNTSGGPSLFAKLFYIQIPGTVIKDLTYCGNPRKLLLLMDGTFGSVGSGSVIAEIDPGSSLTADIGFLSGRSLRSIDIFTQHFITLGRNNSATSTANYFVKNTGATSSCTLNATFPLLSTVYCAKMLYVPFHTIKNPFDYKKRHNISANKIINNVICDD